MTNYLPQNNSDWKIAPLYLKVRLYTKVLESLTNYMSFYLIKNPSNPILVLIKAYDRLLEQPEETEKLKLSPSFGQEKNILMKYKALVKEEENSHLSKSVSSMSDQLMNYHQNSNARAGYNSDLSSYKNSSPNNNKTFDVNDFAYRGQREFTTPWLLKNFYVVKLL